MNIIEATQRLEECEKEIKLQKATIAFAGEIITDSYKISTAQKKKIEELSLENSILERKLKDKDAYFDNINDYNNKLIARIKELTKEVEKLKEVKITNIVIHNTALSLDETLCRVKKEVRGYKPIDYVE